MAQLSRPFQIALVAIVFFALAWLVFLHGHGSSQETTASSQPGSSAPATSSSKPSSVPGASLATTEAKHAAAPTPIYKGSAPGVAGLSKAIAKAHEAVATSQQSARQLEGKSGQASNGAPAAAGTPSAGAAGTPSASAAHSDPATHTTPATGAKAPSQNGSTHRVYGDTVANTSAVESELKAGKTVLILFWNPLASDDRAVRQQVQAAKDKEGGKVAAHYALAKEVGSFGSITRNIPVYQTPTLLVIGSNKKVTTVVGFPDAFGIEQAISEARR